MIRPVPAGDLEPVPDRERSRLSGVRVHVNPPEDHAEGDERRRVRREGPGEADPGQS